MGIEQLTDDQLDSFESNYRKANKTDGGKFSLSELLLEKLRRKPATFGTRQVATKIVELAQNSEDGLCTYGQIWSEFRPNTPWEGHKTLAVVAASLGRVVHLHHEQIARPYDACRPDRQQKALARSH